MICELDWFRGKEATNDQDEECAILNLLFFDRLLIISRVLCV